MTPNGKVTERGQCGKDRVKEMGDRECNRVGEKERGERERREIMSGLDMMQVPPTPPDPWKVDRMDVGSADELSSTNTVMKVRP